MNFSHRRKPGKGPSASRRIVLVTVVLWLIILIAGFSMLWYQRQQNAQKAPAYTAATEQKQPERLPVTIALPNSEPIPFTYSDFAQADSLWVIVNKQRFIPTDYVPENIILPPALTRADTSRDEQSVREEVAYPLKEMFDAAEKSGLPLMMASGYRPASVQKTLFDTYVRSNGLEYAQQYSAQPGTSEHQTGLAVDISTSDRRCYLEDQCFINLPEGKWLAENAYKYGFILRYPEGKEAVTGYSFESWHYRYVGKELATALYKSGLVLDEALPYFEKAKAELNEQAARYGS